jgi:hypothetical protein
MIGNLPRPLPTLHDDDIFKMMEVLYPILHDADYDMFTVASQVNHNLIGLIQHDASYTATWTAPFPRPVHPAPYDPNIPDAATPVVRNRMEAAHATVVSDFETYTAAEIIYTAYATCSPPQLQLHHNNNFTAIADTGASHHYCHGRAPTTTFTAPPTMVNIANGECIQSIGQAKLLLPDLPLGTKDCHIMSTFTNNLLSMGRFCNAGCTVIFTRTDVKVINKFRDSHSPGVP